MTLRNSTPDDSVNTRLAEVRAEAQACAHGLIGRLGGANGPLLQRFPIERYAQFFERDAYASYRHVPDEAASWCGEIAGAGGEATLETYHRAVLAALIADPTRRLASLSLPASVIELLRAAFAGILAQLRRERPGTWLHANDPFAKDFALCRLKLIPCGAELMDAHSGIPRRLLVTRGPAQLLRGVTLLATSGGFRPWYESHWDRRNVRLFNPRGYDECYLRVAELLQLNPHMRGMTSTGWWFDPAVATISPNLAFLSARPQEGGARLLKVGVDAQATRDALAHAPERARLHAEGKYRPEVYMLVWRRSDLLAWARGHSASR